MVDETGMIRFEDVQSSDVFDKVDAALKEIEYLRGIIEKDLDAMSLRFDEDKKVFKARYDEYWDSVGRYFDYVGDYIDATTKYGTIVENSRRGAKIARKESNELNRKYGKFLKK